MSSSIRRSRSAPSGPPTAGATPPSPGRRKGYDHLTRRYVPLEVEQQEHGLLVTAELQYVWTETGDVGDTTRVGIALGVRDGLVSSWELLEDIG